jgi:hypothetical protein
MVDLRGIEHHTEYDSRGRTVVQIEAAEFATGQPTPVQARTETDYAAASSVVEVRTLNERAQFSKLTRRAPLWVAAKRTRGFRESRTVN